MKAKSIHSIRLLDRSNGRLELYYHQYRHLPNGYDDEDRLRSFVQSAKSVDLYLSRSNIGNITNYKLGSIDAFRSYSNTHELTTVDGTSQSFDVDGQLTDSLNGRVMYFRGAKCDCAERSDDGNPTR